MSRGGISNFFKFPQTYFCAFHIIYLMQLYFYIWVSNTKSWAHLLKTDAILDESIIVRCPAMQFPYSSFSVCAVSKSWVIKDYDSIPLEIDGLSIYIATSSQSLRGGSLSIKQLCRTCVHIYRLKHAWRLNL